MTHENERFHLILPMERAPILEAVRVQLPLTPGHPEIRRQPNKDSHCESSASQSVMKLSDNQGSGKISRSNNTTRMAFAGNENETGTTPDALKRMWIGVVHPPHPHPRGCFTWRPLWNDGCPCMRADYDAVGTPCSHPALAALLNFRTDKKQYE